MTERRAVKDGLRGDYAAGRKWPKPEAVVHLAAIVGFPACQAVGRQVSWRYNVDATKLVYQQACDLGAQKFIFSSSYSNYGLAPDGKPVTEQSPLNPQSLYAETKIAAEQYLLEQRSAETAPVLLRLATLYGISPRTRFDLDRQSVCAGCLHQAAPADLSARLLAFLRARARRGSRDDVRLEAPAEKVRGQVYNLGTENGNYTKDQIVGLVLKRMPETEVEYKDLTFGGDMRDITRLVCQDQA